MTDCIPEFVRFPSREGAGQFSPQGQLPAFAPDDGPAAGVRANAGMRSAPSPQTAVDFDATDDPVHGMRGSHFSHSAHTIFVLENIYSQACRIVRALQTWIVDSGSISFFQLA